MSFISIVFENCESIVIPIHRVKQMVFGNITPYKDYPFEEGNAFRSDHVIVDITYQNESDLTYNSAACDEPLGMFINNPTSNLVEDRPNILGRIMNHNDITIIELLDSEQKHIRYIYVPWHSEDGYNNRYLTKEAKEGILHIEIRKTKEDECDEGN